MSASNWAICPQCLDRANAEHAAEVVKVMALYGKVSVDEFDAKRGQLLPVDDEAYRTLREDYEFYGADQGEVVAVYHACCTCCALSADIEERRRFYTPRCGVQEPADARP